MRQVPCYLLIGNGCISKHFQQYFQLLKISFNVWDRKNHSIATLKLLTHTASHILIAISDQAIDEFIQQHLSDIDALCIHFSGSLICRQAFGAHPLMTFNNTLYDLKCYQSISFIIDDDAPSFNHLLPGLTNPHVRLHRSLKAKYHALCVLSGNFSCLLWQRFFSVLQNEFHLPKTVAYPYLMQQMKNIIHDPSSALTGPLVRHDTETIIKNIAALEDDPFQKIYQSFVDCYFQMNDEV